MARHFELTLADVSSLKLHELNWLVGQMDEEAKASKRPPGSTPVMT